MKYKRILLKLSGEVLSGDKGTGIDFVRDLLNIQTFSGIGDSMNDLPMLNKTDISFTFSDSPEAMQKQADNIVTSVADAILKL